MSEILLSGISKDFNNKKVLKGINLSVQEGQMISLLGPSGCGKTTTLKVIAGLIEPDGGDILMKGQSILSTPIEKRGTVIVFQDYLLFPHLTIRQNIGFGLKMAKADKNYREDKVQEMLDLMELKGQEEKYPNQLSGGQKQRVALARALAVEPKVLLLDEPFSNLDLRLRETMREFICSLQKKLNITTILVTHDKEEALMISDKIAVMLEGEIKQFGSPVDLYENPVSEEVANFFGEANYLTGTIEKGYFNSSIGKFQTHINHHSSVRAMIRPEKIEISSQMYKTGIKGTVIKKRYAGDRVHYRILLKDIELKCIAATKEIFHIGQEVSLNINGNNIVFYEG
ncbi:ABC transporter ATP-binding protein [Natronincola ferrireducens]|uniref:ABC-type quaternary amine transporter n=1 Tax=Natronincola ferrireducens TaxID=393762 RepID=A0A1G9EHG4_9FIRM|nr:ABC transporter ATP-binding protein [Natronincola ferrireducens]SDK75566.1 ABC-type Fe3+/spermidine/putrescine transport systems, ATPase components [Natronincola ferrireducens]